MTPLAPQICLKSNESVQVVLQWLADPGPGRQIGPDGPGVVLSPGISDVDAVAVVVHSLVSRCCCQNRTDSTDGRLKRAGTGGGGSSRHAAAPPCVHCPPDSPAQTAQAVMLLILARPPSHREKRERERKRKNAAYASLFSPSSPPGRVHFRRRRGKGGGTEEREIKVSILSLTALSLLEKVGPCCKHKCCTPLVRPLPALYLCLSPWRGMSVCRSLSY